LILAPRHPERFDAVANLLGQRSLPWARSSVWIKAQTPLAAGSVFLLDSIGELASVYSLAAVAFVGGSLVPVGGHNPLEPAQFGVPMMMGTHTQNFRAVMEALTIENAIAVTTPENLSATLHELLTAPEAVEMGLRAYSVFEQQAGATERTLAVLEKLLPSRDLMGKRRPRSK
jgi:3-deoxy-D-manno-octulosonic-acid transferase